MVNSTEPQDVLALGRQLVDELGLEPGVDTLGRWMAHHVAELLSRAETDPDEAERERAKERAVDTILRIWNHRSNISRLNPLADLEPALVALSTLALGLPPWVSLWRDPSIETATARIYELLRGLVINLLLMRLGGVEAAQRAIEIAERTGQWQSDEEREVASHLEVWIAPDALRRARADLESRTDGSDAGQVAHSEDREAPIGCEADVTAPEASPSPSADASDEANDGQGDPDEEIANTVSQPQDEIPSQDLTTTIRAILDSLEQEFAIVRAALNEDDADVQPPYSRDLSIDEVDAAVLPNQEAGDDPVSI
ncbi:MAG: hypothetical protein ACKVVP_07465 [Chloroflexota bacterium]